LPPPGIWPRGGFFVDFSERLPAAQKQSRVYFSGLPDMHLDKWETALLRFMYDRKPVAGKDSRLTVHVSGNEWGSPVGKHVFGDNDVQKQLTEKLGIGPSEFQRAYVNLAELGLIEASFKPPFITVWLTSTGVEEVRAGASPPNIVEQIIEAAQRHRVGAVIVLGGIVVAFFLNLLDTALSILDRFGVLGGPPN
jgi:hypothetical protein